MLCVVYRHIKVIHWLSRNNEIIHDVQPILAFNCFDVASKTFYPRCIVYFIYIYCWCFLYDLNWRATEHQIEHSPRVNGVFIENLKKHALSPEVVQRICHSLQKPITFRPPIKRKMTRKVYAMHALALSRSPSHSWCIMCTSSSKWLPCRGQF